MTLKQKLRSKDDSGAALVIALVFITVASVAIAGVLAYADANVRATEALRRQADNVAAAESAAEIAINTIRKGDYQDSGDCFPANTFSNLSPSVSVTCEPDATNTVVGNPAIPSGYALRALQVNPALEDAINIKANGSDAAINVAGDVESASNVKMDAGDLHVAGDLTAKSCSGTIIVAGANNCGPTAVPKGDPNYADPPPPPGPGNITSCSGSAPRVFQPGIYSNLNALNQVWSSCTSATVFDFRPGVYYFDFNGEWKINRGTTIAGRHQTVPFPAPAIPGACTNPLTNLTSQDGVTFVFGDRARLLLTGTAKVEICGRRPASGSDDPAIAFYGLKHAVGSVREQRGCITSVGGCSVISTDNHSDTVKFYFQGHVYMPRAKVDLYLLKDSDQFLNGGLTARAFSLFSPASSTIPTPLSSGPHYDLQPGRIVVLLTVRVAGKVRLKVKVGFEDEGGEPDDGNRPVTIYNWSVVR